MSAGKQHKKHTRSIAKEGINVAIDPGSVRLQSTVSILFALPLGMARVCGLHWGPRCPPLARCLSGYLDDIRRQTMTTLLL